MLKFRSNLKAMLIQLFFSSVVKLATSNGSHIGYFVRMCKYAAIVSCSELKISNMAASFLQLVTREVEQVIHYLQGWWFNPRLIVSSRARHLTPIASDGWT